MPYHTSPTFTHRFRPLTAHEVGLLVTHLVNSGTSFKALERFTERLASRRSQWQGSWIIPLPGDSNLFYVIGESPEWLEPLPTQQELRWHDDTK